jgi:hypothetical protein
MRENISMASTQSEFQEHFSSLSDKALMEIHSADLVTAAKAAYDHEMTHRGLVPEDAGEPETPELSSGEKLVSITEFESAEDAAQAQAELKKNGIPAYISVSVPAAFTQQAVSLLDPGVSDEELAKLAESAAQD